MSRCVPFPGIKRKENEMKKAIILFFALLVIFIHTGCESKTTAYGDLNEMVVLADSAEIPVFADTLSKYFFPGREMPHYETSFGLKFISFSRLDEFKYRKNFFLIGTLEGDNGMSIYLNRLLPEDFKAKVKTGEANFTYVSDLYAYRQNVYIFAAKDIGDLLEKIKLRCEVVRDYIDKKYKKDLEESMFEAAEQKALEEYLLKAYGMTLRIQHDYYVARQSQDSTFIWLRRYDPYREISRDILIRYYDDPDTIEFSPRWLEQQKYYNSQMVYRRLELIVKDETKIKEAKIGKYDAIELEGTWRTENFQIGGPFSLYGFYVPELNRIVTIDLSLTAVGRRKTPYMDQLELLAGTFRIGGKSKTE
jgi:hypothetical protein